jgi:hypothetical protein
MSSVFRDYPFDTVRLARVGGKCFRRAPDVLREAMPPLTVPAADMEPLKGKAPPWGWRGQSSP